MRGGGKGKKGVERERERERDRETGGDRAREKRGNERARIIERLTQFVMPHVYRVVPVNLMKSKLQKLLLNTFVVTIALCITCLEHSTILVSTVLSVELIPTRLTHICVSLCQFHAEESDPSISQWQESESRKINR